MADRYFVETPIAGPKALLTGAEAHHLAHVMRASAGDEVVLIDGSGAEFVARIERVARSEIELQVLERRAIDRELAVSITLGVALPKGDRPRWLVEKAVELGVARVVPLSCERSNDRQSPAALARLERAVIESSKQCGRNTLMEIGPPSEWADYLEAARPGEICLVAHPGADECARVVERVGPAGHRPAALRLAIGPEGGFTAAEVELAAARGWHAVGFGPRILRVETAALALVAIVASRFA